MTAGTASLGSDPGLASAPTTASIAGGTVGRTVPGAAVGGRGGTLTTAPAGGGASSAPRVAGAPSAGARPVGAAAPNLASGPGVTPSTVTVGMAYSPNAAQEQEALGNTAATSGDIKADTEAIVHDINQHGGVAGRRLAVVFHPIDATSTQTQAQIVQAACADFTQDHHVLIGMPLTDPTFSSCMQKAGALVANGSLAGMTTHDFARFPNYYDVQMLATDHIALNWVDALVRNHYFTGWNTTAGAPGNAPVKVGILAPDKSDWAWTVPHVLVPSLRQAGVHVDPGDVEIWHFPDSTTGNGQAVAQIQSAVLKFRSDGVTHVLLAEQNSSAFFASAAESQHYRPRYGINSASGIQVYAGSLVPYAQLNGAVGVGWSPALDLPAAMSAERTYAGPGRARCMKVYQRAGIGFDSTNATAIGLLICDLYYSVQAVLNSLPPGSPINATTYLHGLEALRGGFPIAGLPSALFGPDRHYPVTRGWTLRYFPDCKCTHYVGAPFTLR
ncbi:MAG TPA: hypothetical protein VFT62_00670 [Mycobacteriales bacterium]|nr:hypothetical protein [Mycobacteriales bacterium]